MPNRALLLLLCALSGYVYESAAEAMSASETVPGETTEAIASACRRLNVFAIVGLLEREGETLYNSAFVVGPEGMVACYRKCHLPVLGIDRYVGRSQIVGLDGVFLAQADDQSETCLTAEIEPALARQKRVVIQPGVFELDPVGGRRPDLYGNLEQP